MKKSRIWFFGGVFFLLTAGVEGFSNPAPSEVQKSTTKWLNPQSFRTEPVKKEESKEKSEEIQKEEVVKKDDIPAVLQKEENKKEEATEKVEKESTEKVENKSEAVKPETDLKSQDIKEDGKADVKEDGKADVKEESSETQTTVSKENVENKKDAEDIEEDVEQESKTEPSKIETPKTEENVEETPKTEELEKEDVSKKDEKNDIKVENEEASSKIESVKESVKEEAPIKSDISLKEEKKEASKSTEEDKKDVLTITSAGGFLLPTYVLPEVEADIKEMKEGAVDTDSSFRKETKVSVLEEKPKQIEEQEDSPKNVPSWEEKKDEQKALTEVKPEEVSEDEKAKGKTSEGLMVSKLKEEYGKDASKVLSDTELSLIKYATAIAETADHIEKLDSDLSAVNLDMPVQRKTPVSLVSSDELSDEVHSLIEDETDEEDEDKPLLLPLVSSEISSSKEEMTEPAEEKRVKREIPRVLPSEVRITFDTGNADISGQTLKWIRAFASQVKGDRKKYVEIRMGQSTPRDIGMRRGALLRGALLGAGLVSKQIEFKFTNRDINSVVLRVLEKEEEYEIISSGMFGSKGPEKIKKW
ncbi:MAG: hypothetical protein PHI50_05015 [Alphaproteobacteria bacterium]|nr:hypothetical protein [Alphaproteobacteria bacterium]